MRLQDRPTRDGYGYVYGCVDERACERRRTRAVVEERLAAWKDTATKSRVARVLVTSMVAELTGLLRLLGRR